MKLLYTGATSFDQPQPDPDKSLGGWISSSQVPNAMKNNMFGDISIHAMKNGFHEITCIAIKNILPQMAVDIMAYFEPDPDNVLTKFKIAAVIPSEDPVCGYSVELVGSNKGLPYNATFYEATGVANAVNLGNLASGKYLCLWILRELDMDAIDAQESCDAMYQNFQNNTQLETSEVPELHLSWSDPTLVIIPSTLSGFVYEEGSGASVSQQFNITGANLPNNVIITAPTDYEIKKVSDLIYGSSVTIVPVLGVVNEDIDIRLKAGLLIDNYDEIVIISCVGLTDRNVSCEGEVVSCTAAEIVAFDIPDEVDSYIDSGLGTVTVTMPLGYDITALIATFILSNGATAVISGDSQESDITENDFTLPLTYTVTAQDGVTTKDWVITVDFSS